MSAASEWANKQETFKWFAYMRFGLPTCIIHAGNGLWWVANTYEEPGTHEFMVKLGCGPFIGPCKLYLDERATRWRASGEDEFGRELPFNAESP